MPKIDKTANLTDVDVKEITLCKTPAVQSGKILIMKSAGTDVTFKANIIFKAMNDEKQIAYGYALVPLEEDLQKDIMSLEEVEKAAHSFMANLSKNTQTADGVGKEHKDFNEEGFAVESIIDRDGSVAKSFGVEEVDIKKGGWWVGVRMNDENWALAKSGDINGFSIGGTGTRNEVKKTSRITEFKKALETKLANIKEIISKARSYNDIRTSQEALDSAIQKAYYLIDSIYDVYWSNDDDKMEQIGKNAQQFAKDMEKLTKINKNLNNDLEGDEDMDPKVLKAILDDSLKPLNDKIDAVTKKVEEIEKKAEVEPTPEPTAEEKKTADELEKSEKNVMVALVNTVQGTAEAVAALVNKVNDMEKAPDQRDGDDGEPIKKTDLQKAGMSGTAFDFTDKTTGAIKKSQ